jgi:hypothetical protein
MKTEKFQLRGNNSVCAGAFQLLRGRAPAQLRGNIEYLSVQQRFIKKKNKRLQKFLNLNYFESSGKMATFALSEYHRTPIGTCITC